MDVNEIKNDLYRISKPKPTLLGILTKRQKDSTIGHVWAVILANPKVTHQSFLPDVLDEFIERKRQIPDPAECLIDVIQTEANHRYWKAWDQHEQQVRVHDHCRAPWREPSNDTRWCRAIQMLLEKSRSDHEVEKLIVWTHGGPFPEWAEEMRQRAEQGE